MTNPAQPSPLPWRAEFLFALRLLARLSETLVARGLPRPVLVGGGAVEFYTGGALMTGDIDVTSPVQLELEEELQRLGFIRPSGPGMATRGWIHPDIALGFEVVGRIPMGDTPDAVRVRLVQPFGDDSKFRILSIEDMIADRMGQFASGTAPEMREQAQELFRLYPQLDFEYLERRIRTETIGDHGIDDIPD